MSSLALLLTVGCGGGPDVSFYHCPQEDTSGHVCSAGQTRACYGGPSGTEGVGLCAAGAQQCDGVLAVFGACTGQVLASPDDCVAPTSFSCGQPNACGSIAELPIDSPRSLETRGSVTPHGDFVVMSQRVHEGYRHLVVEKRAPDGALLWSTDTPINEDQDGCDFDLEMTAGDGDVIVHGTYGSVEAPGVEVHCSPIDFGTGPLPTVTGGTSGFVARLSGADGAPVSVKAFPPVTVAAAHDEGGVVVGGWYGQAMSLGGFQLPAPTGSSARLYLARLDASGEPTWVSTREYDGYPGWVALAIDGSGTVSTASVIESREHEGDPCAAPESALRVAVHEPDDGSLRFERSFSHPRTYFYDASIAAARHGRIALTARLSNIGAHPGTYDFGGVSLDGEGILAVLDAAQGDVTWARSLDGWFHAKVMFDPHGGVILAGPHHVDVAAQVAISYDTHAAVARYTGDGTLFSMAVFDEDRSHYATLGAGLSGDQVLVLGLVDGDPAWGEHLEVLRADP